MDTVAATDRLEAYRYTAAGPDGVATAILAVDGDVPEHCRCTGPCHGRLPLFLPLSRTLPSASWKLAATKVL